MSAARQAQRTTEVIWDELRIGGSARGCGILERVGGGVDCMQMVSDKRWSTKMVRTRLRR